MPEFSEKVKARRRSLPSSGAYALLEPPLDHVVKGLRTVPYTETAVDLTGDHG
jgi:hypothetical protein